MVGITYVVRELRKAKIKKKMQYSNYQPKDQREGTWYVEEEMGMEIDRTGFFVSGE